MTIPNDSVFTTHRTTIQLDSHTDTLTLVPLGDIHYDSDGCDKDRLSKVLTGLRDEAKQGKVAVIMMGDENDMGSFSERRELQKAKLHDDPIKRLDREAWERVAEIRDRLQGIPVLGVVQGNHTWAWMGNADKKRGIVPGETTTNWLARQLGAEWLGFLSYIRLSLKIGEGRTTVPLDIVACHGKAGGKLVGTSINQVDDLRVIFPGADIYLMGHNHQRGGLPVTQLRVPVALQQGRLAVKQRRQYLCRTGGFLRAYLPGEQSYPVQKLLRPTDLGVIRLLIRVDSHMEPEIRLVS